MASYVVADVLDDLFNDAHSLMAELSAQDGTFTLKQFLQAATQRNQPAYIALLNRCLADPAVSPFNAAHRHFGQRLSLVAQQAGYQRETISKGDTDIFGNPTDAVIYRKEG